MCSSPLWPCIHFTLVKERDTFNKERDAAKAGAEALQKERDELRRDKQRLEGELRAAKALASKVSGEWDGHSGGSAVCEVHAAFGAKQVKPLLLLAAIDSFLRRPERTLQAATLKTQVAAAQAKQTECSRAELHAIQAESKVGAGWRESGQARSSPRAVS